jgi:hypothetical protein
VTIKASATGQNKKTITSPAYQRRHIDAPAVCPRTEIKKEEVMSKERDEIVERFTRERTIVIAQEVQRAACSGAASAEAVAQYGARAMQECLDQVKEMKMLPVDEAEEYARLLSANQ